jgi:hypothetical protein
MAYTVNALSGFLQIGPHYFPKRRDGAQIIMRGPHGQRLAADPVRTREGRVRGSGFRFWSEQLNIPADVKWNPQQVVTGVMGMGGLGELQEASREQRVLLSNAAKSLLREANTCPRSTCGMTLGKAKGLRQVLRQYNRWESMSVYGRAASLLTLPTALWNWREITNSQGYDDWHSIDVTLHAAEVAASKREKGQPVPGGAKDPAATPGNVGWGSVPQYVGETGRPGPDGECHKYDFICQARQNWWKIAIGIGGVVVLYGLATGAGRGFAAKRL